MRPYPAIIALVLSIPLLGACGQTGPLYHPQELDPQKLASQESEPQESAAEAPAENPQQASKP